LKDGKDTSSSHGSDQKFFSKKKKELHSSPVLTIGLKATHQQKQVESEEDHSQTQTGSLFNLVLHILSLSLFSLSLCFDSLPFFDFIVSFILVLIYH
jgi:hypothetical protein